jgi:hypothetical protein
LSLLYPEFPSSIRSNPPPSSRYKLFGLKRGQMSDGVDGVITNVGRFGLAARGVVFAIVGIFLTVAALRFDPNEAAGLGEALQELLRQPFGAWILGILALGFVAYGLLMLAVARYGRIASGRVF